MNTLKVILILVLAIALNITGQAQYKVKETSEKEIPGWINQTETGYIIVKGSGTTLKEAEQHACTQAKDSILNISLKKLSEQDYFKNKDFSAIGAKENLSQSEYIKAIGPDNIQAVYWEKLYYKKTKTEQFDYTIKYPVDLQTIQQLIDNMVNDYELLDKAGARINLSQNIDELIKVWQDLLNLKVKFTDSEPRKTECKGLIKQVGEKIESVQIKEMLNIPGKLTVAQTLNDRGIISSAEPTISSPCAKVTNVVNYMDEWRIEYSYDKCPINTLSKIKVEFDNGYTKNSEEFNIDLAQIPAEIKLSETIIKITNNKSITIYISSRYRGDVLLDKIILRFNDINFTETELNQELNGAGLYNIDFTLPPGFETVKIHDGIRGELHYTLKSNGQKGVYRFYNHKAMRN